MISIFFHGSVTTNSTLVLMNFPQLVLYSEDPRLSAGKPLR